MKNSNKLVLGLMALSMAAALSACGKTNGVAASTSRTYSGTQSPGDVITITMDFAAGTFSYFDGGGSVTSADDDMTFTGTLSVLSSGFLKFVVTAKVCGSSASDCSGVAVDGSQKVYGFESPGTTLFLKPSAGDMMALAYTGECSAFTGNYNWVEVAFGNDGAVVTTDGVRGTAAVTNTGSAVSIAVTKKNLAGATLGGMTVAGTCSTGGVAEIDGSRGFVSAAGGLVLDQGAGAGGIIAFKENSVGMADVGGKTYIGLLFHPNSDGTQPVKVAFSSQTAAVGSTFTDIEADTLESQSVNITLTAMESGVGTMTVSNSSSSTNGSLVCIANNSSSKVALVCIGTDVGGGTAPLLVVLTEK